MTTIIKGRETSAEIRAALKAEGRPVLVAFSGGKDAIAAELALQDEGIESRLAYLYYVPGTGGRRTLKFVEDGLDSLEQSLGKQIHKYPHPSLFRMLNNFVFQPPERCALIEAANFPTPEYNQTWDLIKEDLGMPADTWVCDGVRAADSIVRRASFTKHGIMKHNSHKVSPIADWVKAEVMGRIEAAGIALPVDYDLFKRSFDGLDYRFLKPISEHFPADFEQILNWFPLADLELFRHDNI